VAQHDLHPNVYTVDTIADTKRTSGIHILLRECLYHYHNLVFTENPSLGPGHEDGRLGTPLSDCQRRMRACPARLDRADLIILHLDECFVRMVSTSSSLGCRLVLCVDLDGLDFSKHRARTRSRKQLVFGRQIGHDNHKPLRTTLCEGETCYRILPKCDVSISARRRPP